MAGISNGDKGSERYQMDVRQQPCLTSIRFMAIRLLLPISSSLSLKLAPAVTIVIPRPVVGHPTLDVSRALATRGLRLQFLAEKQAFSDATRPEPWNDQLHDVDGAI